MVVIRHMAVLIPARNEEVLLPRCLSSVMTARMRLPRTVSCDISVAVDSSTDQTLQIAQSMLMEGGSVLTTDAGSVGVARALAAEAALRKYSGPLESCWLANTDADCAVPENWLVDQLALAQAGAQALAGTVEVDDFSEHHDLVVQRFREAYCIGADGTHPHVHGANIGIRADVYREAGGWAALSTAEDHDLWNRLSMPGCSKRSVAHLRVFTSGRRVGRAPHGFAAALASLNEALA